MNKLLIFLLVLSVFVPSRAPGQEPPRFFLTVPRLTAAKISVDGVVDKREWFTAQQLPFLHNVKTWGEINRQLRVYLQYDDENLYIGFVVGRPRNYGKPAIVLSQENEHLGEGAYGLFGNEDRVRVIIITAAKLVLEISGNAASIAIVKINGKTTKAGIRYQSRSEVALWEGEFRIPLALLGGAREFAFDFLNLQATPAEKMESLAYRRNVKVHENLWTVSLTAGPVTARMRTELFGRTYENAIWLDFWNDSDQDREIDLSYRLAAYEAGANSVTMALAAEKLAALPAKTLTRRLPAGGKRRAYMLVPKNVGQYVLQYRVKAGAAICAQGILFINIEIPLAMELRYYFLQHQKIRCTVSLASTQKLTAQAALDIVLSDAANKVYDRKRAGITPEKKDIVVYLDTRRLKENGKYAVTATLSHNGNRVAQKKIAFVRPKTPEWFNSRLGLTAKVAPGFEPLRKTSKGFKLAMRNYIFGGGVLPRMIESRGEELLAGPITLQARVGGEEVQFARGPLAITNVRPTGAKLEQRWTGGGLRVAITGRLDYDGFIKYDVDITGANIELEKLTLAIPVRDKYAEWFCHQDQGTKLEDSSSRRRFSHPSRFPYGELKSYYRLHPGGWMPFTWSLYLGCPDRGIEWVAESDRSWSPENEARMIRLVKSPGRVTMVFRFVDKPIIVTKEPRRFSFGIIATPVREIKFNDYFKMTRTGGMSIRTGVSMNPQDDPKVQKMYAERKRQGFRVLTHYTNFSAGIGHPLFSNIRFYDEKHLSPIRGLHGLCRKHGIIGVHYCGYSLPPGIPDNETFGDEMREEPSHRPGWYNHASPFRDYWLHGAKFMVENAKVTAFHTDGLVDVHLLINALDNFAWRRNGKLHGTYPVFAVRELFKRFYHLLKFELKEGIVGYHFPHVSGPPVFALQSFSDIGVTGEQLYHLSALSDLSLTQYRMTYGTIYQGLQRWGIWHYKAIPITRNMIQTLHNLHGVLYHYIGLGRYNEHPYELMGNFLPEVNMWRELGRDQVEFRPYWQHPNLAKVTSDVENLALPEGRIKVSAYVRKDLGKALLVVANLDKVGYTLRVRPNLTAIGLAGKEFSYRDPILKSRYTKVGAELRFDIYAQRWRAIMITARRPSGKPGQRSLQAE